MTAHRVTPEQIREVTDALAAHGGNQSRAAQALGLHRSTFMNRLHAADRLAIPRPAPAPPPPLTDPQHRLADRVRELETELKFASRNLVDAEYIKRKVIGLTEVATESEPPKWLKRPTKAFSGPGVPTLFASDWHWGEIVDPKQIGGVNEFNMAIAHERARTMVEVAIDLLRNHINCESDYPGIVFALGGDMVSGGIHPELVATDEREIMPVVVDLFGVLAWCIEHLAGEFGRVFVPCVSGNHGRSTEKIRNKGRNFTSFDWLVYQFLAKRFESDHRVAFLIPDGPDALYGVMGHRYLLTHGDNLGKGGDGIIGAIGPIIRGDHRKRSRNAQIDMGYQTLICGHYHQLIQLERVIVNGSLKGMCEYAYTNNFGFEVPRQALWLTHPSRGITFSAPVNVDRSPKKVDAGDSWVTWKA